MPRISQKSLFGFIFSAVLILAIVFLDPDGKSFESFDKNFKKTTYFENCSREASSQTATSSFFHVVDVADGDTILISQQCEPVTVRLIGIDTPETVDPRKPVQCFGNEASQFTKNNLLGKEIMIETDSSQDTRDKYGRLLGYVILSDGTNFNKTLIEQGYAFEYTYKTPYAYQKEFKDAEKSAKENLRGLWNPATCASQ